jgi:ankyrin repeat protein
LFQASVHVAIVNALLAVKGIDVNKANDAGETALIHASICGQVAVVNALLAVVGIDVNQVNHAGETALMCATRKGFHSIVAALLAVTAIAVKGPIMGRKRGRE